MLREYPESKWIDCFARAFSLSGVDEEKTVAILSETQSRQVLVELSEYALAQLGARSLTLKFPTQPLDHSMPTRSTGSSKALEGYDFLTHSLASCDLIIDVTVEGQLHSPALQKVLRQGGRLLMISNEHPEVLERCMPDPQLKSRVDRSLSFLTAAREMVVTSEAGTNLKVNIQDAPSRGGAGFLLPEQNVAYWPAGLALCFPVSNTCNGQLVFDVGDVNLTFKKYFESRVTAHFENDFITSIEGNGLDAQLLRDYYARWNDQNAYAISHVGWGLNPNALWESLMMYDKTQINGTELRAIEGSFMISTGANEHAGRFTSCHFDFPMRNCTVALDGFQVVDNGKLAAEICK